MPAFLENALRHSAAKAGKKGKDVDKYVFGAMNNLGAMHGNKETEKGAAMDAKHEADETKKKPPLMPSRMNRS